MGANERKLGPYAQKCHPTACFLVITFQPSTTENVV